MWVCRWRRLRWRVGWGSWRIILVVIRVLVGGCLGIIVVDLEMNCWGDIIMVVVERVIVIYMLVVVLMLMLCLYCCCGWKSRRIL